MIMRVIGNKKEIQVQIDEQGGVLLENTRISKTFYLTQSEVRDLRKLFNTFLPTLEGEKDIVELFNSE